MRRALLCVLLWGCLPTVDLELPPTDPPAEAWLLLDPELEWAEVFDASSIELFVDPNEELIALAYFVPLEQVQLELGPLEIVASDGRPLPLMPDVSKAFVGLPASAGARSWSAAAQLPSDLSVRRIVPDRCFEHGYCRPDREEFDVCEVQCGGTPNAPLRPIPPSVPRAEGIACAPGEYPFPEGCRRVGAPCPPAGTWPSELPPDAVLVDGDPQALIDALAATPPGGTIAVRGDFTEGVAITKQVTIRGTCPEEASLALLTVEGTGAVIDSLHVEDLFVLEDSAVLVARSNLQLDARGQVRLEESLVRGMRASGAQVELDRTVATGMHSWTDSTLSVTDSVLIDGDFYGNRSISELSNVRVVDVAMGLEHGTAAFTRFSHGGAGSRLSSIDTTVSIADSILRPIVISGGRLSLASSWIVAGEGERGASILAGATLTASDLTIDSGGECIYLSGLMHDLNRVQLTCDRAGIITGRDVDDGATDLRDARISAHVGIEAYGALRAERLVIEARHVGSNLISMSSSETITMNHVLIRGGTIGIAARTNAGVAVSDFSIDVNDVGVDLGSSAGPLRFARGIIHARTGVAHRALPVDDLFFQTAFDTQERILSE